jgi:hypothetical protein
VVVSGDPGLEDLRVLNLRTEHWTETRIAKHKLSFIERKGKFKHHKGKSSGLWPDGTEMLIFVQQQEKSGQCCRRG